MGVSTKEMNVAEILDLGYTALYHSVQIILVHVAEYQDFPKQPKQQLYKQMFYSRIIYTGMDKTCLYTSSWEFICEGLTLSVRISTSRRT